MNKLFVLAACTLVAGLLPARADGFDSSGYAHHLTVTVSDGKLSAGDRFTNIPVLLRLGPAIPGFDYADFRSSQHADLAIVDSAGNLLPFEVARWNSRGESSLWVVLPELSAATVLHVYYGGNPVTQPVAAWTGYLGVWHFDSADFSDGKIGGCASKPVVIADGCSAYNPTNPDQFTASGWFKASHAISDDYPRIFQRAGVWQVELDPGPLLYAGTSTYGDGNYLRRDEISGIESDWVHLSFVYSGRDIRMYVNGQYRRTAVVPAASAAGSAAFAIGSQTDGKMGFDGLFDEVRLSDGAADEARVAAEYAAMADAAFFAYDLNETKSRVLPSAFAKTAVVTLGEGAVEGTHFNVPVLLRVPQNMDVSSFGLAFADEAGRLLAHEVEGVDDSGNLRVWVLVPELSAGTKITLYWGGAASDGSDASAVWNGYGVVRHAAASSPELVEYSPALDPTDPARFTVSGFFKAAELTGAPRLFSRSTGRGNGWEIEAGVDGVLYVRGDNFSGRYFTPVCAALEAGEEVHLAFVYDGGSARVYVNGAWMSTLEVNPVAATTTGLGIGRIAGGGYEFNGVHREVRLYDGALSADEIALDCEILTNNSFASFGTVRRIAGECTDFAKRIKFSITNAVEGTLAGFPVPVKLSTAISGFDSADVADDFSNAVFVDEEGAPLPYEVETWNPSGESLVWVRVPAVSAGAKFWLYYGGEWSNAGMIPETGAWGGYRAVFHMAEDSGAAADSASGLSAEPIGTDLSQMSATPGVFGVARMNQTTADTKNRLSVPYSTDLDFGGRFTASGWFKGNAPVSGWPRLFVHKGSDAGWWVECEAGSPGLANVATVNGGYGVASLPADIETWHHWAFVYNGTDVRAYLDGKLVMERTADCAAGDPEVPFDIGGQSGEGSFNGAYDEIRLSPLARNAAWAKAEFLSGCPGFVAASQAMPARSGLTVIIR